MLTPAHMHPAPSSTVSHFHLSLEAIANESGRHTAHDEHVLLLFGISQRCEAAQRFQYPSLGIGLSAQKHACSPSQRMLQLAKCSATE